MSPSTVDHQTISQTLWERYREQLVTMPSVGMRLDVSRMDLDDAWLATMAGGVSRALAEMAALEAGAIANSDENRRVGHYWLRDPARAPEPDLRAEIEGTVAAIRAFADRVHAGSIAGERGTFQQLLVVGIGGSSLGPRFVAQALGGVHDRLHPRFIDNTDPDGIDRVSNEIGDGLGRTLTVVISKSGGTKETRNGMLEVAARYRAQGLSFARHAVAVTGAGSQLDRLAHAGSWLATFPMWDWVGGRTSELSAVGLLPAALQGIDISRLLDGARAADEITRAAPPSGQPLRNPALALALAWHHETGGRGEKDMVILPYKDRLALFSQYLQQLVMESLGKERDRDGKVVHQGIAVYGNKGSTDQHAYVQQLRDGVANFFVTFIEVLADLAPTAPTATALPAIEVEPGVTSGDFLEGFYLGTRRALYDNGRRSITITLDEVTPHRVGALIALYERAVGYYASLINVNAYHQPGVEAGKKAAEQVIALELQVVAELRRRGGAESTAEELAQAVGSDDAETAFHVLEHLAANPGRGVARREGPSPTEARYSMK